MFECCHTTWIAGYRTPFWVGDVVEAFGDRDGTLEKVTIHFRMPQAASGLFCDDLKNPWNLACHALHTYDGACERKLACKAAAEKAGSSTSKFTYTCEAAEILETKLEFSASRSLKAQSTLAHPLASPWHPWEGRAPSSCSKEASNGSGLVPRFTIRDIFTIKKDSVARRRCNIRVRRLRSWRPNWNSARHGL